MNRIHLRQIFQRFKRNRKSSILQIVSLVIGFSSISLLLSYVQQELSYDNFNKKNENIFRLVGMDSQSGELSAKHPLILLTQIKENIPSITVGARLMNWEEAFINIDENTYLENAFFLTDKELFDIISIKLLIGNKEEILKPNTVLISKSCSKKYFGNKNPLGKQILIDDFFSVTVGGVFEDLPYNSHLQFNMLGSINDLKQINSDYLSSWEISISSIYIKTLGDVNEINYKINEILEYHFNVEGRYNIFLQPFKKIYLNSESITRDFIVKGSKKNLYILTSVALFILLITALNYVILSISSLSSRNKEFSVKKLLGVNANQFRWLLQLETFLFCIISFCISLIIILIVNLSLPELFSFAIKPHYIVYTLFLFVVTVSIFSVILPSKIIERLNLAELLKGENRSSIFPIKLGDGLVGIQLIVSTVIIIVTIILYFQFLHLKLIDKGLNPNNILVINNYSSGNRYNGFVNLLNSNPNILCVSAALYVPPHLPRIYLKFYKDKNLTMSETLAVAKINKDFFKAIGAKIIQGRDFDSESRKNENQNIIINRTTANFLNLDKPIGKSLITYDLKELIIIGVIEDINYNTFFSKTDPMVFFQNEDAVTKIVIKTKSISESLIGFVNNKWKETYPELPFSYYILEDSFIDLYKDLEKVSLLLIIFTIIAMSLSLMGCVALLTFILHKKTKENAIRIVHGARFWHITNNFIIHFSKIIVISSLIAYPIAYYVSNVFLSKYVYKISISFTPFIGTSTIIFILISSIILINVKTNFRRNPSEILRTE